MGLNCLNLSIPAFSQCSGFFFPTAHSSRKALRIYILLPTLMMYRYQPCSRWPTALAGPTAAVETCQFNSGSKESHRRPNLDHRIPCNTPVLKNTACV